MRPYYHWHRPHRLFWFILGAGTATFWIRSKQSAHFDEWKHTHPCTRHRIPNEAYPPPSNSQQQEPPAYPFLSTSADVNGAVQPESQAVKRQQGGNQYQGMVGEEGVRTMQPSSPEREESVRHRGHHRWGWSYPGRDSGAVSTPPPVDKWEDERKKLNDFSKKANETFQEISEATLDSLLSTVEGLKARLAENRAERERQAQELQALKEEQMRQYEEWKKQQPPRHIV
ncbi:hypothetical protein C8Q75DRAFT_805137 [Abortiporus biennis]|nr:hypothetical protein C8Q75DRAFT_805137 [Abortiporus biennis]